MRVSCNLLVMLLLRLVRKGHGLPAPRLPERLPRLPERLPRLPEQLPLLTEQLLMLLLRALRKSIEPMVAKTPV